VGKVVEHKAADFFRALQRNPVIPSVRTEREPLEKALSGDHPAIFVLGGNIFKLTRRIGTGKRRPLVFVNVDIIGGVTGDATGIEFLSQHVEEIISTNRHVIELANSADLITIQRLFTIDAGAIERGLKLIKRAKPRCVEILPALAYPPVVSRHPEVLDRPVLAGGLLKSPEEVLFVLRAGAAGVSTSHQELWTARRLTRDFRVDIVP
jgi:glycerol uptake operon antiterminator